jgi:hypothetical protein
VVIVVSNIRTLAIFTDYKLAAFQRQDFTLSSGETGKWKEQKLLGASFHSWTQNINTENIQTLSRLKKFRHKKKKK